MSEPIQLSDLRRKSVYVDIGAGQKLAIRGLTALEICDHLDEYEAVRAVAVSGTLTWDGLLKEMPRAVHAWVASACGHHRDKEAEEIIANNMTADLSTEIVEVSLSLTFSRGFGPFKGRLVTALQYITEDRGPARATPSQQHSSHAESHTTNEHGTAHPGNSPRRHSLTPGVG